MTGPGGLAATLRAHVDTLAGAIGPRGPFAPEAYQQAEDWIAGQLESMGHAVTRERVESDNDPHGPHLAHNLIVEIPGPEPGIWIAGAHYDTVPTTPGADDNTSAVAILLEMARALRGTTPRQTLRLVFLANEEMPYFTTKSHGAMVHAAGCRARGEKVQLMASLEMLGYFTDAPGSQRYPLGLEHCYPDTGNFVAFIGSLKNAFRLKALVSAFRHGTEQPAQMLATPVWAPALVRSDHFAFVLNRYPAVLITDTADFRNPHYHGPNDTPDTLDYDTMARVTQGLTAAFSRLAGA